MRWNAHVAVRDLRSVMKFCRHEMDVEVPSNIWYTVIIPYSTNIDWFLVKCSSPRVGASGKGDFTV